MRSDYVKPPVPVPPSFDYAAPSDSAVTTVAALSQQDWWAVFHDPVLDALESQASTANKEIRIAIAHFDESQALVRTATSQRMPTVSIDASVFREREAQDRPNNGETNNQARTFNDVQIPLLASYEIDAWGRVRRSIEAAHAGQQASADDLRVVNLSIHASLAIAYFDLRQIDEEIRIADLLVVNRRDNVTISAERLAAGLSSATDLERAKLQLSQEEQETQAFRLRRSLLAHQIAVYVGVPAQGFRIETIRMLDHPPGIPATMPSDLLLRRPDIAAADRRVAAASARIGIAKAAYRPRLSLVGFTGYESTDVNSLVNWQNSIASLVLSAAAPVFTGGRLRAGVEIAQAQYGAALHTYEQAVLSAYKETEDELAALHWVHGQLHSQNMALAHAQAAYDLALNRYQSGLSNYLEVVSAQQQVLTLQAGVTYLVGRQLNDTVALIRALGGGWEAPLPQ